MYWTALIEQLQTDHMGVRSIIIVAASAAEAREKAQAQVRQWNKGWERNPNRAELLGVKPAEVGVDIIL
jgi:hypothetical protein